MKNSLPDRLLSQLSEFIAAGTALHFPRNRWSDLEQRTSSAAEEFGFTDKEAFIQWLVSSPLTREQIEILASHLTISETYFWRAPQLNDQLIIARTAKRTVALWVDSVGDVIEIRSTMHRRTCKRING